MLHLNRPFKLLLIKVSRWDRPAGWFFKNICLEEQVNSLRFIDSTPVTLYYRLLGNVCEIQTHGKTIRFLFQISS